MHGKKNGKKKRPGKRENSDIGKALRSVYETTVGEDVPDEMLDLLKKLR